MKTKYLLLGAIFALFGFSARAQVSEMYFQGFESGEPVTYTGTPTSSVRYSTTIRSGGNRALKLVQTSTEDVEIILDTIDFTQNTTLRYIALRIDHICRIPKNSPQDYQMAKIYYKRANQTDWTSITGQEYNTTGQTHTQQFIDYGCFYETAYSEWSSVNSPNVNNTQWHSERFDLDNVITPQVSPSDRKLLIKFVLKHRTLTGTLDTSKVAWWIDNIKVSASSERMVTPKITMYEYPTVESYPNSRGAHIELAATTTLAAGIKTDSVFLVYTGGSDPTQHVLFMTQVPGVADRYECRIPFYGYDTLMRFYCVAHDATSNRNRVTFPATSDTWIEYRSVRGSTVQLGVETPQLTPTSSSSLYPLPRDADHRCEFVYDSALLAAAGYGPGAITSLRFKVGSGVNQVRTDPRFQIKMKNVPTDYTVEMDAYSHYNFTPETGGMQIVYDSALSIPIVPSNTPVTINLQDTFFYAGKDILMQITYDNNVDRASGIEVKTITAPTDKKTIYFFYGIADYGYNPWTHQDFRQTDLADTKRPAFVFTETHLQPLLYDVGFDTVTTSPTYGLVTPNNVVPMTPADHSIQVRLKNYGAMTCDSIRISYEIDDNVTGYYDLLQSVASNGVQLVTIAPNVPLPAGFHTLKVWVEDTLQSGTGRYRDHEPYNDTVFAEFVVCDGPMKGVKVIGSSNTADFATIEEFLFSLSRCGIEDSLIVRLAPGTYAPFTMPAVTGLSGQNYLVFESLGPQQAMLYADGSSTQTAIVDVEAAGNVHFRNLKFIRQSGPLTDMVRFGDNSNNCRIEGCTFTDMLDNPVSTLRINSMVNSGYADNLTIDSCTFTGGNIGVNAKGSAPDNYSVGITVRKSTFTNQYTNAVKAEYMDSITFVDNEMYDVLTNASYVVLLNGCSGAISVERNRVYTTHGAGAMALSDVVARESKHALVANNMIVSNDDGSANQLTTPFNVIQGQWIDVLYNSVKLKAPTRTNVATATFGALVGDTLQNSRFMNNIIASFDDNDYAFSYLAVNSTTNRVSNNVYYSTGTVLNRRGTSSFTTLAAWQAAMPDDTVSVSVNPSFICSTPLDLRTYNRNIKGIGYPVATVSTDIYGTLRGDSATCPGAFEFSSIPYDFEPEALVSPEADVCNMPASVELVVRMRNNGINVYDSNSPSTLYLACKVNNGPVQTMAINQPVPADDTVTVHTGYMLNLPSGTYTDVTYTIRLWNTFVGDPNQTNDTNVFTVVSRYHPSAPADILDSIDYLDIDTITPTVGVDTWQVYGSNSAPRRPSQIFWYHDSTDATPFYVGNTYITDPMQDDATYYIRQRRAMPMVRITQVEILRTTAAVGLTSPMPGWMVGARKAAVQLTNIGDATAYLEGDTLMTVSTSNALNSQYRFGNVKIEPGQSLVIQYVASEATDSNITIRNGITSTTFAYNSNVAFVYKRGGVVEDAIPLNSIITANNTPWTAVGVPSYVWSGSALTFQNNKAGIIRTSFNGNVGDWEISSAIMPMTLGRTDPDMVWYTDNGCDGDMAIVEVAIRQPPIADVNLSDAVLPESGCGLGIENVTVRVTNYGGDTISNIVMNYCAGGDTITETIVGDLLSRTDTVFTFATPLNLAFPTDSVVTVRIWADTVANDPIRTNDTIVATVTSLYTPLAPDSIADRVVTYATRDTITLLPQNNVIPVWYDYDMNPVDTGFTHISEILYGNGTMGVSYLAVSSLDKQIGTATTVNSNATAFPSPYQSSSKFAKQQYLYSAHDLASAGVIAGNIRAISFYLDTMVGNTQQINYLDYTISMGLTPDTVFTLTTAAGWKSAPNVVFQRDTFTLYQQDDHAWVTHPLSTPFVWDGVSSIVVEVSYNLTAAVSTGIKTQYTAKPNTTLHKNQNSAITPTTSSLTKGNNRPNVKFLADEYGCSSPITPYNVTLSGLPMHDASIFWAADFDTLVYNSCDTIALPLSLRNQGSMPIDTLVLHYYLDNLALDSTVVIDSFAPNHLYDLALFNRVLSPGHHTVTAIVHSAGDTITSNDTIRTMLTVRFCGGSYTIAANDLTADYQTFGAAIDTLNQVGIVGPVVFEVNPGVYNEQVILNNVNGSSDINTISFVGMSDSVLLTASTSQAANYVMMIDGASNVRLQNIMIEARPVANNVNYANALVMQNDSNIRIAGCYIKVKGTIVNTNASCIVVQGNVSDLTITGTVTDSGYYAFRTVGAITDYSTFHFYDNIFRDFSSGGLYIRDINGVKVVHNEIRSGNSANNRGLTGIYIASTTDTMVIEKNAIYLVDEKQGAKRGIQLENITGTVGTPAIVVNNMISCHGTGSAGLGNLGMGTTNKPISAALVIDSSSAYINVLFNSMRVRASNITASSSAGQITAANDLSCAMWCGSTPTNVSVMNNIISNFGFGYAYYVREATAMATSNYNAFYTEATKQFAWGTVTDLASFADLQTQSSKDGNSVFEEPFFLSNDDLHMRMTNFAAKAQYNTEVVDDIDGNSRPQIPGPTIGAHEKDRLTHDMAVVRIHKPVMPENINNPTNVETDSVCVVVSFHNNGLSNETNVMWYAYIEGYEGTTTSVIRNLGSFTPAQLKMDSVMVPTQLGIIDTQYIHVVVLCNNDVSLDDNEMREPFYLAPAFNLAALKMEVTNSLDPTTSCNMSKAEIKIQVKNSGSKTFPAGTVIKIGYHTEVSASTYPSIATLPDTVEEDVTLPVALGPTSDFWFTFDSLANLYPTDNYTDIKVRVKGWVHYEFDITPGNDSTTASASSSPVVDSWYRPAPPEGHDVVLPYGTWGTVTADQENTRPIRWFRDSTDTSPFFTGNNYNLSRVWNNTPQYFADSTYYLNALSAKGCPSYFSEVHVSVAPRKTRDMAVERMLAPLGNRVYMENDTVRVQIANYGTTAQSGFPITYLFKRGNNVLQQVTDTVRVTLAPAQVYAFTFDSLLSIPTPTSSQNYTLSVWTDLTNDATPRNDTLRYPYTFVSLPQQFYLDSNGSYPNNPNSRFDITRVSYNGIELAIPPMDRSYTNLANYPSPDYPVLHVTRGTSDSIFVEIAPIDPTEQQFRCRATVFIDFDRDGRFETGGTCNETVVSAVPFYSDSVFKAGITIPPCASYGYMRMRVKVAGYGAESPEGHIIDFLLFVDEVAPTQDLAITQIVSPRNQLLRDNAPKVVRFRLCNYGQDDVNAVDIHYSFVGDTVDPTAEGVVNWTGSLPAGRSTVVALPEHLFPYGTSSLTIWHEAIGDVNTSNDTLNYEYYRFRTYRPVMSDNFDDINQWFAPKGYNDYSRNFWRRGMPYSKPNFDTTYSGDFVWITGLSGNVNAGAIGSVSYLYSPIINIAQVRPDTIGFRLRRRLAGGSTLRLEYLNFEGKWVNLAHDSASASEWYNDTENGAFTGNTTISNPSHEDYYEYRFISATSLHITSDFLENTQFRFVYTTPIGGSTFGAGCAVDNFYVGRARRAVDAGIVDITEPATPKYGQTLYPQVVVKNYGYDTLRSIRVGYTYHGTYLARYSDFTCLIPPDSVDTFWCTSPFIVTSDFPEEFHITAFTTRSDDIYRNNDTLMKMFTLRPLDNDISAESLIAPLDHVVAGDTAVKVTLRIRNFGLNPVTEATASYIINNVTRVDEHIDFLEVLGRPLDSLEYFNYTFHRRITAPMGLMNITAIIKSPNNDYIYNDTVSKRTEGIMSITDIAAKSVVVFDDHGIYRIGLEIDNVGSRGVNNFEVGYWIDYDTTTMVRETYYRSSPLAALNTGYYLFENTLPQRSSGYSIVSGFVHVNDDNDLSNDTTDVIAEQFVDVEVMRVLVEENASNDCRVLLELRNNGNLAVVGQQLRLRATINGSDSNITNIQRRVDPGDVIHVELNRRIPKSPTRQYVGSGWIRSISGDNNQENDQTSIVEVINYFEDAPTVNGDQLVLEQNYPNPFSHQTTIPFTIPNAAKVRFFVMDAMGHIVHRAEKFCQAGSNHITIDMDDYAAGIYYYGIEVNGQRQMRKMILK